MKNPIYCLLLMLCISCSSEEKLDRDKALNLLKESERLNEVAAYNIFITDPTYAKRMLDAGLEHDGLLTIQRTQKLSDAGKPLIIFKEKAKPYLIPQCEDDKKDNIQRVKIAEQEITEVTGIQMLGGEKTAVVEYKTSFRYKTPFSKLSKIDLTQEKINKARFTLYDDGWRLVNK